MLAENDGLLSLTLSSRGGEGTGALRWYREDALAADLVSGRAGLKGTRYSNSLGPVLTGAWFSGGLGLGGCVPRRV